MVPEIVYLDCFTHIESEGEIGFDESIAVEDWLSVRNSTAFMLNKEPIPCVCVTTPLLHLLYAELLISGEQFLMDLFEYCCLRWKFHYQQAATVHGVEDGSSELIECLHVITNWCRLWSWRKERRSVWGESDIFLPQLLLNLLQLRDFVRIEDQTYFA